MATEYDLHPSDQALEQYALGRLPEDELASLEEHLLICPGCQDRLAETDAFIRATRQAAHNFMMLPPSRWQLIRARLERWMENPAPLWAAAAAAVLAVVFLAPRLLWAPAGNQLPVTVILQSVRGPELVGAAQAPAARPLRLRWDTSGLDSASCCRLELVDASGRPVVRHQVRLAAEPAEWRLAPLAPGRYWLRLYALAPGAELLREFGLQVR